MKNDLYHPSAFIGAGDVKTIRRNAAAAEKSGGLQPEQLSVIRKQKWFTMLTPRAYGGAQIDLPALVRLQEAISWTDGSTGWVVTLCSGAGWFGGFIETETARRAFSTENVCLAGSGAVGGTAEMGFDGYVINGFWKYASGIHHATHITANCAIQKGGQPVLSENGEPLVLPFIFDKNDVNIRPAWDYVGMVATGSDAFEIKDIRVHTDRCFKIDADAAMVPGPLYRYPFLQLAEATLAVNLSGIAIHFTDLCEEIFTEKIKQARLTAAQKIVLMDELKTAKNRMTAVRRDFFAAVGDSWDAMIATDLVNAPLLEKVSATSRALAHAGRECVDRLYPFCGLAAAGAETEINRAWRDLHTASQHSLLTF
ncbi:MAG TPA: hypothetical protein VHA56_07040 [Mucilaginibacter sp.]|nr:hypothetical protein [Mucilaginibacter sp.]